MAGLNCSTMTAEVVRLRFDALKARVLHQQLLVQHQPLNWQATWTWRRVLCTTVGPQ